MIHFSKRKKIVLLSILGIVMLLMLIAPSLVKNYAINNSKELLGRQIDIGKLQYNYFTSTVNVQDFKMYEANEVDEFVTFETLILNFEPYRLIFNEKVIEQFYIEKLMVNTILEDSTYNFDDLIAFHMSDSIPNEDSESDAFKYEISNIELSDGNFIFDNRNLDDITKIEDLSFLIPIIRWDQEQKSNADVKFNFENGGYLESSLNINPVDGEYDAFVNVKELSLEPFYKYVLEYAEINSFNGLLNCQIEIKGNTNEPTNAIVSGHVDVHDFIMTDMTDKKVLGSKRIDSNLKEIDYANSNYILDSLKLSHPYVYFKLDSTTNNMFKILKLDSPNEVEDKETINENTTDANYTSDIKYAINKFIINDGILDYSDNLTGEQFDYHLSKIEIDSDSIQSDSQWINIYSDMLLNERGTLKAKLGINPTDYTNLNLDMVVENFLLSDLNIYSKHYVGHNILQGDFYYYANTKIINSDLFSENQLLVKNVSVENVKGGLFSLPLKFALFLLKDKNGDVNLNVPVRGDLNDPSISVGKIVWTTLKNKITGTAENPMASMAALIDVDPKDYEEIVFVYTDTIPGEEHMVKFDKLIEIEMEDA